MSASGDRRRALGDLGGLREVYPDADEQRCWNHRIVNVLDQVPKRSQEAAKQKLLKMLLVAETKSRKLNAPDLLQDVWESIRSGTLPDSFVV